MDEMTPDPTLEAYAALEAELQGIDKRMEALEHDEVLESDSVDAFVASLKKDRPTTVADLLSADQLMAINEAYDALLHQGVQCARKDYALAAVCGVIGGIIDVLFASNPENRNSPLEKFASDTTDNLVMAYARKFPRNDPWKPRPGKEHSLASAIAHLEKAYKVGYDQETSTRVGNVVKHLSPKNHHAKSLSHYPDLLGLVASVANQFTGTSTFVNGHGGIVIVKGSGNGVEFRGNTFFKKLICGFANWIGHCMSDVAGSSGGRGNGGFGMGLPLPMTQFFQLCNFGRFANDKGQWQTFSTVCTEVFEQGYDTRHGLAMAVPVALTEVLVRLLYAFTRIYRDGISVKEAVKPADDRALKRLIIVGQGSLCLVDVGHAAACALTVQSWVEFFCKINLLAWIRFGSLGLKELANYLNREMVNLESIQEKIDAEWDDLLARSNRLIADE